MRRRGVGVGRVKRKAKEKQALEKVAGGLAAERAEHLSEQMGTFRANLETFAAKHRSEINANPEFRRQFAAMCSKIGVDPLASSKGFWAELLGVGDFYFELAVQVGVRDRGERGRRGWARAWPR